MDPDCVEIQGPGKEKPPLVVLSPEAEDFHPVGCVPHMSPPFLNVEDLSESAYDSATFAGVNNGPLEQAVLGRPNGPPIVVDLERVVHPPPVSTAVMHASLLVRETTGGLRPRRVKTAADKARRNSRRKWKVQEQWCKATGTPYEITQGQGKGARKMLRKLPMVDLSS